MARSITALGSYIWHRPAAKLAKQMGVRAGDRGSRREHVDLHLHSSYSDGFYSPRQLAVVAGFLGLKAVALTDHDSFTGSQEMRTACSEFGISSIPAIELHTTREGMHILGYHMSFSDPQLLGRLNQIQEIILENVAAGLRNLKKAGCELTAADIKKIFPQGAFSIVQLAEVIRSKGKAGTLPQGLHLIRGLFEVMEPERTPPYFSPAEAVRLIHKDGGIPIWAHPGSLWDREEMLKRLLVVEGLWGERGLMGLEFAHGRDSEKTTISLLSMIDTLRNFGIDPILTIGSDFHDGRREKFGLADLSYEIGRAEALLARLDAAHKDKTSILIRS